MLEGAGGGELVQKRGKERWGREGEGSSPLILAVAADPCRCRRCSSPLFLPRPSFSFPSPFFLCPCRSLSVVAVSPMNPSHSSSLSFLHFISALLLFGHSQFFVALTSETGRSLCF
ncbi:uncharacterized protein DS421_4g124920 [Arachis hypogaea]|nr:uncharacterized protein DS421_4g124920 [Arachis hypogaea]